jgi:hypothetical protein
MTMQVSKTATAIGKTALDAPIFDPAAFRLNDAQTAIIARARELGQAVFASRAAAYDREATFSPELHGFAPRGPARDHFKEQWRPRCRLPRPTRSPPPRSAYFAARPR